MKNIAKYSVNKPISVLMGILIVILLGVVSLTKLPLELFPDINLPYAVVVTTYEGKTPEEVEKDATIPIEQNLLTINNVKAIQSTSRDHFSMVIVEFEQSTNMDTAFLDMRESFEMLSLKDEVGDPMIVKFDPNMIPVMTVSLSRDWGDVSDTEALIKTTEWVKEDILNKLERISGVASVSLSGASDTEVEVVLDEAKLTEFGLSQSDVLRIIKDQNIEGLVGIVPDGNAIRMLYIGSKIEGIEGLENTPINYDGENEKTIYLKDLASVGFINTAQNQYMKINGKQGISISFQKQSDVGITDVVNEIQKTLTEIVDTDEYDASYVELLNQGDYIEESVGTVISNLIIGGILAVIILFVFLRDIRPTLVVGFSIPISVIGAFALMYLANISLNIVSMGGLALGVGMLVDNSIVVIENIFRLLNEGKSRKEAAIQGASQVASAITSSTLTTMAVFLPIVFIEGLTADLFYAMALTVTFSLVASLVIAISLVPTISANFLKQNQTKEDKIGNKMQIWYEKVMRIILNKKALTLIVITLLLGLSIFLGTRKGFELIPATDEGIINVNIEMEKGTAFNETASLTDNFVAEIMKLKAVDTVSAEVGGAGFTALFGGVGATDSASITVLLSDDRKVSTLNLVKEIEKIRDNLAVDKIEKIQVSAQSTTQMAGFGGTGIQYEIKGQDIRDMRQVARDITEIIKEVEGTKDHNDGIAQIDESIWIEVNKENAIKRGITENDIVTSLNHFYNAFGMSMTEEVDDSLVINVNGIEYDLNLPSNEFAGFSFTYDTFLQNIKVFDYRLNQVISAKLAENDKTFYLYVPQLTDVDGVQIITGLMLNPYIVYNPETNKLEQTMNPLDPNTLNNLAKGSIYENEDVENPITQVEVEPGIGSISRDGKTRIHRVSARIETGYVINDVSEKVEEKINAYLASDKFKPYDNSGIKVLFVGENEEIKSVTNDLIIAGVIAVLLVFMIMAIQFQSLKYPFIVLFTIPLAFTGGLLALFITGLPISMVAMVGLIILSGIVVNNGIVLVDYINQLREEGKSIDDAIIEAGKTRLRPILMTALTTILALVPMAIGYGEGGELLRPLGVTAIGGLLYATILTLVVAPIMYRLLNRKDKIKGKDEE